MASTDDDDRAIDHEAELEKFITKLSENPQVEQIVSEIGALHSIYGDGSVRVWKPPSTQGSSQQNALIRYEIHVEMSPPHDSNDLKLRILASVPYSYPESSSPQLQLLNRYIGPYKVDSGLFGSVLRTFMSKDGVEFSVDNVCIFDGVENVKGRCGRWYEDRLSDKAVAEMQLEDEIEQMKLSTSENYSKEGENKSKKCAQVVGEPSELPPGIDIFESEPFVDRKSVFIGRACKIVNPSQVNAVLAFLLSDRKISRATHPIINAWRCRVGDVLHQDNDDDGENAAGARLAHLLQILDLDNVMVVVTRYYGGIQLGPDRFKHINHVARKALEVGGFLDAPEPTTGRKAQARHKKHG